MAKGKDESGDQSPGLRATIPSHSGFAAWGEARELVGVSRKLDSFFFAEPAR
jgi:hypothetical protein